MIQVQANPIGVDDFHGFANRICEGTEQILKMYILQVQMPTGFCDYHRNRVGINLSKNKHKTNTFIGYHFS